MTTGFYAARYCLSDPPGRLLLASNMHTGQGWGKWIMAVLGWNLARDL